jgi:protein-S-isoprenylcysteine O-methyltransferase Ste14
MLDLPSVLTFVILSAVAVVASCHAFRTRQAYGLFRFLAFETIAVLVALNVSRWFLEPSSSHQVASWVLLLASSALALHGVHLLRVVGQSRKRVMEETQSIVEVGAYRYIRHPLYAALLLFAWGVFFKSHDLTSAALALAASLMLVLTARYEEGFNLERFGEDYAAYMKRTKMSVPFML